MKDLKFWKKVSSFLNQGIPLFCAIVAENTPHSPGTKGAKLALPKKGKPFGTIGGGAMEYAVLEEGKTLLYKGDHIQPYLEHLVHRKDGSGKPSGMICSGEQTNLYFILQEKDITRVKTLIHLLEKQEKGLYRISPSRGLDVQEDAPMFHCPSIRLMGRRDTKEWIFEEELVNRNRIAIFGAGHCGKALSWVMEGLGYWIELLETRQDVATFLENHFAHRKILLEDFEQGASYVSFPQITFAVVMTVDQPTDVRALKGILHKPFPYIGVMGSKNKIVKIFHDLEGLGYSSQELRKSLYAPIGMRIQSHKPEEIAISIAAQIIEFRNQHFPELVFFKSQEQNI